MRSKHTVGAAVGAAEGEGDKIGEGTAVGLLEVVVVGVPGSTGALVGLADGVVVVGALVGAVVGEPMNVLLGANVGTA